MKNIIFIGPSGSGKGTQCMRLMREFNFFQLSTGEILRERVERGDALATELKKIMNSGEFVSDDIIISMVSEKILEVKDKRYRGIIFDGFPRTKIQAEELEKLLSEINLSLDMVIEFYIDDSLLVKRITGRYNCLNCHEGYNKFFKKPEIDGVCDICKGVEFSHRGDDNEMIISNRLKDYHEISEPLTHFYNKKGILRRVDGSQEIIEVEQEINSILSL